ncbi:MAG: retroviral-like aspartic protease [Runella slithyformis]|jgi:clan AA aspartic protease|nr:MAG: retroviral-like aspartic protease [Runella slithyformis]TAF96593.1 MAG: retroviral-like aspartic protease [Runella sp.]TAG19940.1 MAG: retroviral-like aspartic protease [Cytophagales bacterium]TAG40083.1 MAG: retroviral-like aspartic protease [Cytophagia bacterium]TAE97670.1 MAG: retroviral-like aspartic protease [Runella slithyformis]
MGLVHAEIELSNAMDKALQRRNKLNEEEVRKMNVTALVDSGAYMMVIPDSVRLQLGLEIIGYELTEFANGKQEKVAIAEPVEVHFENRKATVDVLVIGNEVLLGAIPMEAMDVLVNPRLQKLTVNPAHPTMPVFRI